MQAQEPLGRVPGAVQAAHERPMRRRPGIGCHWPTGREVNQTNVWATIKPRPLFPVRQILPNFPPLPQEGLAVGEQGAGPPNPLERMLATARLVLVHFPTRGPVTPDPRTATHRALVRGLDGGRTVRRKRQVLAKNGGKGGGSCTATLEPSSRSTSENWGGRTNSSVKFCKRVSLRLPPVLRPPLVPPLDPLGLNHPRRGPRHSNYCHCRRSRSKLMDTPAIVAIAAGVGILGGLVGGVLMGHWLARRNRNAQQTHVDQSVDRERAAGAKLQELLQNKAAVPISPEIARLFVDGRYAEAMSQLDAKL